MNILLFLGRNSSCKGNLQLNWVYCFYSETHIIPRVVFLGRLLFSRLCKSTYRYFAYWLLFSGGRNFVKTRQYYFQPNLLTTGG